MNVYKPAAVFSPTIATDTPLEAFKHVHCWLLETRAYKDGFYFGLSTSGVWRLKSSPDHSMEPHAKHWRNTRIFLVGTARSAVQIEDGTIAHAWRHEELAPFCFNQNAGGGGISKTSANLYIAYVCWGGIHHELQPWELTVRKFTKIRCGRKSKHIGSYLANV